VFSLLLHAVVSLVVGGEAVGGGGGVKEDEKNERMREVGNSKQQ